ncbi:MAG: 4,5-DOPA dioxygenase extradiol [Gammaproteobacteria bacterium]|nr:4,5-DOPA dioxygenase extradiol [Gammaproteobacteria bacterium]
MHTLSELNDVLPQRRQSQRMPMLFVGHGSPMVTLSEDGFAKAWRSIGRSLPVPVAVLCVSAHWMTRGQTHVLAVDQPETIHDFGGFPQALFDIQYPAPGAPALAAETTSLLADFAAYESHDWGLDHGTWSVVRHLFPDANIPVYQVSVDMEMSFERQQALGETLSSLRERGVLIVGSGNVVHNLRMIRGDGPAYDWAETFDRWVASCIARRDFAAIAHAPERHSAFQLAHPTVDHYAPLNYVLGAVRQDDAMLSFNEAIDLGSASMTSYLFA